MSIVNKKIIFFFLLFVLIPFAAGSHPHVFIKSNLTLSFDNNGLKGVYVEWSFDEFFSSMIAGDFDRNKNGKFENSEIRAIYNGAFKNLKNFNYFTFISLDSSPYNFKEVNKFSAKIKNSIMTYSFFIPFKRQPKEVILSQFDSTYYTDVHMSEKIRTKNSSLFVVKSEAYTNKNKSFYFGQVHPREVKIAIRRKK